MTLLLNPWVWLAFIVWTSVIGGGGFLKGRQMAQDSANAAYSKELVAIIHEHNENALIDMEAAAEVASAEATARARALTIRSNANVVIHANPAPAVCRWDDKRFGVLNAAITESNGDTATTDRLFNAVEQSNSTGKPR